MAFPALVASADRLVLSILGETVSYMPRAGGHVGEITSPVGVFQNAYLLADIGEAGVATTTPAVFFRLSDLFFGEPTRDVDEDDPVITRNGTEYVVREAKPDGEGGILFLLRESE